MGLTTPNKEIVRRICHLNGGTKCYMLLETKGDYVEILTDIPTEKISTCVIELKEWSGIIFKVFNYTAATRKISEIILLGEKILPIKF